MTEREELELAAKAAGIGPLDFDYAEREGHGMYFGPRIPAPKGGLVAMTHTYWRPKEDDGDALRLAVKVGMRLELDNNWQRSHAQQMQKGEWFTAPHNSDPYAATRLAIFRAAVEIGRAMP